MKKKKNRSGAVWLSFVVGLLVSTAWAALFLTQTMNSRKERATFFCYADLGNVNSVTIR